MHNRNSTIILRFEGEENNTKDYKREQIQQQRTWLEMQIREKKLAQDADKEIENVWQKVGHSTAQRSIALAKLENECRQKLLEAHCQYNQALVS